MSVEAWAPGLLLTSLVNVLKSKLRMDDSRLEMEENEGVDLGNLTFLGLETLSAPQN